jgi:hypothetical protein
MAYEVVRFRAKQKLFHMTKLEVAIALTAYWGLEHLNKTDPDDTKTRVLLEEWLAHLRATTAFFDPEFDDHLKTDADRKRFIALFDRCATQVATLGNYVPSELLNGVLQLNGIGSFEEDFPATMVLETLDDLRDLLL